MSRRLTALLLALCMVMTTLPTGAFAADGLSPVPPQQQTQNSGLVQSAGLSLPEEPYSEGLDWTLVGGGNPGRQVYDGAMVLGKGAFEGDTLVVPGVYMDLPVKQIYNDAFKNCELLTSAFLNSEVIGFQSFQSCANLTSVIMGDNVKVIHNYAFRNCTSLTEVVLGEGVTKIWSDAFSDSANIAFTPYGGALYLGTDTNPYHALIRAESTDISEVTIHPDTRMIADQAFAYCTNITEVYIPGGEIGDSAFQGCTALRSVTMGDGVTGIGSAAFAQCNSLTDVHIGDGVTYIGNSAFFDTRISNLHMGANVQEIDDLAFMGSSLRTIVLPEGLERIGANAFDGNSIQTAVIPSSVTEIGRYAFPNKSSMQHVLYLGTMEQWYQIGIGLNEGIDAAKRHYACSEELIAQVLAGSCALCESCTHSYVLMADTSTCTTDGENSYECDRCGHTYTEAIASHHRWEEANCTQPRRCTGGCGKTEGDPLDGHIWIAATCTTPKTCSRCGEIENGLALHSWNVTDCTQDKTCTVCGTAQAAGKHYYSDGICEDCGDTCSTGLQYEKMACYYLVSRGECTDTEIVIPENHDGLIVYEILAFGNSETVTGVTVPATVGKIRDNAFANCTALKEVILPDSIREIGVSAFSGCTSLQAINIPAALKEMPAGMFAGCTGLQNVVIPDGVKTIGGGAFQDCVSLKTVTLPDSVTEMGTQTFYRCTGLQEVTIGNGLRTIPEYTFTDCSALQKLTIGDNVETIAFRAFYNCSALEELTIPDSVTQIAMDAFGYCTALTDLHLGSSLQTIGNAAFSYCRALEDLTIPDNVSVIDDAAFLGCESLTKLDLGNGVQRLGVAAFEACRNLTEVILPVSLTSIGDTAFSACYGVEAIFYEGTLAQWEAVTKPEGWHWMPRPDTPVYCLGQCRAYGHAWIEATCTEVKYCPICGTAEGEALGHDYQEEVINPTCEESGYTKKTCSRCNDWFVVEGSWKNPVGHDWQYATCTQPDTCSFCGTTRGEALGHMEYTYDEPPTCTTPGGTVHACYRCDETYLTDEIPALGHTPGSGPNCNAGQICEVCKIELQPALGHDWVDASCETPKTCSRCGLTEGAALGHNYQAEVTAPTCIEEGYTTHTCAACGDSFVTDTLPSLGHSYENGVCIRCGVAQASEGLEYALSEDGCSYIVIGIGDCEDKDLIIPATYNGLPVAAIGAEAFAYDQQLRSVVIPDSVTKIGDSAFTDSWYLESVQCGSGVTEIGYGAFSSCMSLKEIQLPSSLRVIGERAFYRCNMMTFVTIPAGVTTIGNRAFYMCTALTGITIPATVETVGEYAFGACSGLTEVIISGGEIGQYAFTNCSKLKNVVIGEGVSRIGTRAFDYCTQLLCITIPATVTQIDSYAFNFCKNLWHVLYLGTQEQWNAISIGTGNTYLIESTLHCEATGNEITDLEGKICGICNCPHDYTVETTQPTCTVDGAKVYTCTLCGHSYTEVLTAPGHSWADATCETAKTCSVCGATEGGIPGHAWVDATCTAPKTCSRCGITEGDALGHSYVKGVCTRCGERQISVGLEYKLSTDGSSYTVSGIGNCMDTDIFIPETHNGLPVTAIANFAFNYAEKVTSITLPDSVTQIGTCAFYGCSGLQEINLGAGLIEIQANAFEECSSLTEVVIPDSVQFIGEAAFGGCENLISVTIGAGVTEMKPFVFRWCEALEKVYFNATAMKDMTNNSQSIFHNAGADGDGITLYIGANVRKIPAFLFNGYNASLRPKLTSVVFEEGSVCESIGIGAFMRCYELTAITIPDTVICIDNSAFSFCTAMTDITLSKNLATLGESAFSDCSALVKIVIPDGITTIACRVFQDCSSLTSVTLSSTTTRIRDSAFWGCSQLESIVIPEGVTHIDWAAFYDCTRLGVVYLPQSVTQVGDDAFYNCTDLWHVLYAGTQEQWEVIGVGSNNDALTNAIRHCNSTGDEVTDIEGKKCRICDCVHEYAQERTEPTCTAEGMIVYTCSICGHSFGETIPARGHNWQDAICTEPKTCSVCFATEGEALGHDFVDGYCTRCGVQDDRFSQGLTYKEYNGGYMVTGMGTCNDTHVKIPAQHNGLPVNAIGAQAFATNKSITAVTIPDSVTVIAYGAFNACTGLTEIVIPDSVTAIYGSAFSSCINLRTITLPAGLTVIAKLALSTCNKLETIYFKGTSLQWEAVTKEAYWDDLSGSDVGGYQLICLGNDSCDHAWQDATCTVPKHCPLCGSTIGEAQGHSYEAVVTAPTCVAEGYTTYTCSRCGDSYEANLVPATGKHNYELTAGKEPTCTEPGGATYTCSMCGDSYTQEDIPALGHDFVGGCYVEVQPTVNSVGRMVGGCVRCSEPVEAELPALGLKDYTFAVIKAPADGQPGIVRYTWTNTTYGEIRIDSSFLYGDANGDGKLTLKDALLMRQYFANKDPDTGESTVNLVVGADANGDGKLTLKDALLLRQYFANKDPDTGESTVVLGPQ